MSRAPIKSYDLPAACEIDSLGDWIDVTGEMTSQVTDVASVSEVCSKHSYLPLRYTTCLH
jgi:hypothetical protein